MLSIWTYPTKSFGKELIVYHTSKLEGIEHNDINLVQMTRFVFNALPHNPDFSQPRERGLLETLRKY